MPLTLTLSPLAALAGRGDRTTRTSRGEGTGRGARGPDQPGLPPAFAILLQPSFSCTVRLKTGAPGLLSTLSTQK